MRTPRAPPPYHPVEGMESGLAVEPATQDAIDERSFAGILRKHQSMVFSIALHFLHDATGAEEVAQDVFLELYRRHDELESEAHVTFWLRRVTSHRSIDYLRKRKLQAAVALADVPEPSVKGDPGDVMMSRRLRALIASLPEKPRMVMVLRYQEEMMPEEIAKVLDMPVRTVKSHLQRALAILREKIGRSIGEVR
jgi:RNA polymerase sigma-70 factor, ECF subfamily